MNCSTLRVDIDKPYWGPINQERIWGILPLTWPLTVFWIFKYSNTWKIILLMTEARYSRIFWFWGSQTIRGDPLMRTDVWNMSWGPLDRSRDRKRSNGHITVSWIFAGGFYSHDVTEWYTHSNFVYVHKIRVPVVSDHESTCPTLEIVLSSC